MTRDTAEVYFEMAVFAISLAQSPSALRAWWEAERAHRDEYGVSDRVDLYDELVRTCRDRIANLDEVKIDRPEPPPKQQHRARARAPRRQLI